MISSGSIYIYIYIYIFSAWHVVCYTVNPSFGFWQGRIMTSKVQSVITCEPIAVSVSVKPT